MTPNEIRILETSATLVLYFLSFFITKNVINNSLKKAQLERTRRKIIIKSIQLLITIATISLIAAIWGVEQNEIALFASTILTAFGIAFFAQWSLLSNITASIIVFFNHPIRLGDNVKVLDKDYPFEGEVAELGYFFIYLKTATGEIITIPNALVLQKSISVKSKSNRSE